MELLFTVSRSTAQARRWGNSPRDGVNKTNACHSPVTWGLTCCSGNSCRRHTSLCLHQHPTPPLSYESLPGSFHSNNYIHRLIWRKLETGDVLSCVFTVNALNDLRPVLCGVFLILGRRSWRRPWKRRVCLTRRYKSNIFMFFYIRSTNFNRSIWILCDIQTYNSSGFFFPTSTFSLLIIQCP